MDQTQIMNLVGSLLRWIVGAMGVFYVIRGLIDIAVANSNDNPNAKDTAYLKLATGVILGVIAAIVPTIISYIPNLSL